MSPLDGVAIAAAGLVAGSINAVVGSGSLITFPTLLAVGYPPVLANVTNCVGMWPGSVSSSVGYRRELTGQRGRVMRLMPASVIGGLTGAALLLALPGAFGDVVPGLILLAVLLVLIQPRMAARRARLGRVAEHPGPVLHTGTFLTAVYGGYFGAAQGVILLALLGITLDDDLQRLNAVKNVVIAVVNALAAFYFMALSDVAWLAVPILYVSSVVGGQLGSHYGRRISPDVLRMLIALIGTAVAVKLLVD